MKSPQSKPYDWVTELPIERKKVCAWLKIDDRYLDDLYANDDWTFVIRTAGLLEAGLSTAVVAEFGEPKMKRFANRLPMAETNFGKVRLLEDLNVINAGATSFLRTFAELRNLLVHGVEHIGFRFDRMEAAPSARLARACAKGMSFLGDNAALLRSYEANRKLFVWVTATIVLGRLASHSAVRDSTREAIDARLELAEFELRRSVLEDVIEPVVSEQREDDGTPGR